MCVGDQRKGCGEMVVPSAALTNGEPPNGAALSEAVLLALDVALAVLTVDGVGCALGVGSSKCAYGHAGAFLQLFSK